MTFTTIKTKHHNEEIMIILVITVSADGLAPHGARPAAAADTAGTVLISSISSSNINLSYPHHSCGASYEPEYDG